MRVPVLLSFALVALAAQPVWLHAQPATPAAPKSLSETASAGLALTTGNTQTSTINLGYEVTYDPKTKNVVKSDGLFLRGRTDGTLTSKRLGLNGRDEYRLDHRAFAFGQVQYLSDRFKDISYLAAPGGGLGVRLSDSARTKLSLDGGAGGVWEKSMTGVAKQSGAVTWSEKFSRQLSPTSTLSESLGALYKTSDFGDVLYTFDTTLAASVTARTQLKVEVLDTFKNRVVAPVKKNDVAVIVGMVFKR